jgi:hypothetical protein
VGGITTMALRALAGCTVVLVAAVGLVAGTEALMPVVAVSVVGAIAVHADCAEGNGLVRLLGRLGLDGWCDRPA